MYALTFSPMLNALHSNTDQSAQPNFPSMHELARGMQVGPRMMMDVGRDALRLMMYTQTSVSVVGQDGQVVEMAVVRKGMGPLKTEFGNFWHARFNTGDKWGDYHALIASDHVDTKSGMPTFKDQNELLVRTDSGCLTGQVFHDMTCDCRQQLHKAMTEVAQRGEGVIVHIPGQDGRGLGLDFKLGTMYIQERLGANTVEAACILRFMRDVQKSIGELNELAEFEAAQDVLGRVITLEDDAEALWDNGDLQGAIDLLNSVQADIVTIVEKTREKLRIVDIDERTYEGVVGILKSLSILPGERKIIMATNNMHKMHVFEANGYTVNNTPVIAENAGAIAPHLAAKQKFLGHVIPAEITAAGRRQAGSVS